MWPKFESEEVGLKLAFTGTIKEDILQRTEIAYQLLKFLLENYRENICERYGLTASVTIFTNIFAQPMITTLIIIVIKPST